MCNPVYLPLANPWTELIIITNSCLLHEYSSKRKVSAIWYVFQIAFPFLKKKFKKLHFVVGAPSMLKGKTLEEIVNRWSDDLETSTSEFAKFAGEVAVWDRALIENGNNVCVFF